MAHPPSDALVFFGATGDLAFKQIFPALQAMIRHGHLDVPVHRRGPRGLEPGAAARAGAREPGAARRTCDAAAFEKLCGAAALRGRRLRGPRHLRAAARRRSAGAQRPLHYLAIPPSLFATVVEGLARAGRATATRASWWRSRSAATWPRPEALNATLHEFFPESADLPHRPLPRQGAGAEPPLLPLRQHLPRADLEPQLRRARPDHHGRELRRAGARALLRGGRRDPRRGAEPPAPGGGLLAMEAPSGRGTEAMRDEKAQALQRHAPARAGRCGARPVPRLPQRGGRGARFRRRDLRRGASSRSTPGAGPACRSTSAPASACR